MMKKFGMLLISMLLWAPVAFVTSEDIADNFVMVPHSAQYQGAPWDNLVRIERGLSLDSAYQIAHDSDNISYFFYTIGWQLVLDTPIGWKVFGPGDTVFFSGTPWWGSAEDLAHGY